MRDIGLYPEKQTHNQDTDQKEQAYSIKGKVDMACSLKKTTRGIECTKGTSQNHNNGNKLVPLRGIKYVNKI